MTQREEELKPCPFCGGNYIKSSVYVRDGRSVSCLDCGAHVVKYHPDADEKAVAAWNRRALVSTPKAHENAVKVVAVGIEFLQRVWANLYFNEEEAGNTFQQTLNEVVDTLSKHNALPDLATPKPEATKPFGYWVEHKLAEPVFLRPPAYIPEGPNYTVTPLYAHPPKPKATEGGAHEKGIEAAWEAWLLTAGWSITNIKGTFAAGYRAALTPSQVLGNEKEGGNV